jgi:hypothetical protein
MANTTKTPDLEEPNENLIFVFMFLFVFGCQPENPELTTSLVVVIVWMTPLLLISKSK